MLGGRRSNIYIIFNANTDTDSVFQNLQKESYEIVAMQKPIRQPLYCDKKSQIEILYPILGWDQGLLYQNMQNISSDLISMHKDI